MNRQQKEQAVKLLQEQFSQNPASFIVGYKGLTVAQMQALRAELRKEGGMLRVAKARLLKRAVGTLEDKDALFPHLKEQIGIVFASDEVPAVAKVLHSFSKDNAGLQIVVGRMDGLVLDSQNVARIATLPSKDVLRAQVCATLQAPITRLAVGLKMLMTQLAVVLKQIEEKKK